jgi:hypothetical protein
MSRSLTGVLTLLLAVGCNEPSKGSPGRGDTRGAISASASASAATPWEQPKPREEAWASAQVVTTRQAGALSCNVKTLDNWVRVACKTADPASPPPLELKKGRVGDLIDVGESGFTYLWLEGQDIATDFGSGSDKVSYKAAWPRGGPKPETVGVFEGGR